MPIVDHVSDDRERDQAQYASFLLRCSTDGQGHLRARLIEVGSGVSHALADLDHLPDLVRRLLTAAGTGGKG